MTIITDKNDVVLSASDRAKRVNHDREDGLILVETGTSYYYIGTIDRAENSIYNNVPGNPKKIIPKTKKYKNGKFSDITQPEQKKELIYGK